MSAGAMPRFPRRRRRRVRAERRRVVALLPQLLTTGNLASGFYSIALTAQGDYWQAAVLIFVAGFFDMTDGRVARFTRATSRFGAEYDTIADTVSFGVAPALLAYGAGGLAGLGWTGWVLAFFYTVCAALRLARFNVSPERYRGRFDGLSSPGAAGTVISSVWFGSWLSEAGFALSLPPLLPGLGVALLGLLMVSPIPYVSFKGVNFWASYGRVVLVVLACVVIASKPQVTLFLLSIVYVVSGPSGWLWRRRTGRELEENPPPQGLMAAAQPGIAYAEAKSTDPAPGALP